MSTPNTTPDTTRRTVAQARHAPQWQRLIDTIHAAQATAGYEGRQFGAAEMDYFGATLVGMPWPLRYSARVYWVERQSLTHSDDAVSVLYVVKAWDSSDPASVTTINRPDPSEWLTDPTAEQDDAAALEAIKRAAFQTGETL